MFLIILPVLVLQLVSTASSATNWECIYPSPNKYIGYYDFEPGHADVVPFYSSTEPSRDICNKKCMANDECLATSIDDRHNCSFYNTSDFVVKVDGKTRYSLWKRCHMNEGDQPPDGRCKGLWVTFLKQWIMVDSYGNLGQVVIVDESSRYECRNKCLANRLCGFITFNKDRCLMVPKWPAENIIYNKTDDEDAQMDTWTCVANFIETFNISTEVRKPIDDKCTGYWLLASHNSNISCPDVSGILFHTQVYRECLAECELHPSCLRAYYNVTYSVCVVGCIPESHYGLHPPDMTFMEFRWVCVSNDSHQSPMNADEQRLTNLGMKCSKIANNKDMFIGLDRCATCPPGIEFAKCDEVFDRGTGWMMKDSCRVNQSYWAFPSERRLLNIGDHRMMHVTRVFTGLELYWLAYLDGDDLVNTNYLECRIFNASRAVEKLNPMDIVSQEEWQHQPAIGEIYPFPQTPTQVVITSSGQPLYSCRTKPAGIDLMRLIQVMYFSGSGNTDKFFDVAYNFFVDDHGNIYQGRGWILQSAAVKTYNRKTIAIGFIGWFKYELPSERFLSSVKKLIEFGVEHHYIDKNYSLYIQQDLGKSYVYRNLVFVIRNWYRYKGFIPKVCSHMSLLIILFNLLAAAVCVILFRIFYNLLFLAAFCKNCKFLSKKRVIFEKIFPSSDFWKDRFSTPRRSRLVRIMYERFPEPSSRTDYFQLMRLVKATFYNRFLNTLSSRCNGNDLISNLRHSRVQRVNCQIHHAGLKTKYGTGSIDEEVVVCVSNTRRSVFLKNLIKGGSCVCMYFKIERIDQNELMKDLNDSIEIEACKE